jgi:peptide/nickel transport system permease protein
MSTATISDVAAPSPPKAPQGYASQWRLIGRRFARHRLAVAGLYVLLVLYTIAALAEFFAPYTSGWYDLEHAYCPPQLPRLSLREGLYVHAVKRHRDEVTKRITYVEDRKERIPLGFFARGERYRLWGLIGCNWHFLGVDRRAYKPSADYAGSTPTFYMLGADKYGQDLLSRIVYGARISLSVGIMGILVTFVLGLIVGGISGYVGGAVDNVIQRSIEIINAFPKLPLWLALGAIMPPDWSPVVIYFGITIVLSLLGWTGLARVVRGKILSLREEDYATAAKLLGAGHGRIIFRHLIPGFASHIIVSLTLSVPGMILGETSLSFLGLGLRPPVVSWGVMLQDCMNIQAIAHYPWMLLPVIFIVTTVLCFNFLGDGLRDAADPYSSR